METIPMDYIEKEFMENYNKNPRGWRVLSGKARDGYYNLYIVNFSTGDAYVLKFDSPFKLRPVGVGFKAKIDDLNIQGIKTYEYGFRPLSSSLFRKVMEAIRLREFPILIGDEIRKILNIEPKPTSEVAGKPTIEGPLMVIRNPDIISLRQIELEYKLRFELEKLIFKKGYISYF
ncbi:MAG: hypothetical protein QXY40_02365 [Candidatus Methanomethylicia archaeon]